MKPVDFQEAVRALPYGKILPTARYLARSSGENIPTALFAEIRRAEVAAAPASDWNIMKLHTDQFAITFLSYPDFDADPHPALTQSTKINLNTGSVIRTDYRARANPPVLHRKETFLPVTDPRFPIFAALTTQEQTAGLYRDPTKIGLRLQWSTLVKQSKFAYEGHVLVPLKQEPLLPTSSNDDLLRAKPANIERHRTAIKRYDLSKPVKLLLERGLLRKGERFFDFGCGHGMDVEALQQLGFQATGWDPAFRPAASKTPAEVVNLGYVLNVIEEPTERIATLREAYSLVERILLVSVLVNGQETDAHSHPYCDGFLTKANTFQKFYVPGELEQLIEQTLDAEVNTLGMGVCLVFRRSEDAELFEANRNRRRVDWTEIGTQLKFSVPIRRERLSVDRHELHKELYKEFWHVLLELGRVPQAGEFDRLTDVKKASGGIRRAVALVVLHHGETLWQMARTTRTEDVLVYLATANFRKQFRRREIPLRTMHDIRSFFGDLSTAQLKARDLLFAAGDPDEIELACEGLPFGWQDPEALIIHRSLFQELPPLLRIYIHCAAQRYGDPMQADLIKIHKRTRKVTFQHYDDFDGNPLPELRLRIKVNLRNLFVEVFDYSRDSKVQLLYFKERFVAADAPGRPIMEKFSRKLRKLGLEEATIGYGPDRDAWLRLLASHGLNAKLQRQS